MTEKEFFRIPYDAALLAYSVLRRLGSGNIKTFEGRLKSQKAQYFAQLFGVSPAYRFNLYVRGPYSPDLAHDLFQIEENSIRAQEEKFTPEELEGRFQKLQGFISDKSTRQLELIATLHWLRRVAQLPVREATEKLAKLKSADEGEVSFSLNSVELLPL